MSAFYVKAQQSNIDVNTNSEFNSALKLYNNNYRPIYHLEKYILYIATIVHDL